MSKVLEVKNLSVSFRTLKGEVQAVRDVSFDIEKGSVTAIVGESGCGKSVTSKSIMGLIKKPGYVSKDSQIIFQGENIQGYNRKQWEAYRGPEMFHLLPGCADSVESDYDCWKTDYGKIRVHKKVSKQEAWAEAVQMLERVGIPNPELRMKQYPHEFSGGMRQRVMIAIAMTLNPDLLIADEPTTALDVTVQADILDMMKEIQKEHPMSIILITHDLGIVANFATDIIVMYAGKIVERGTAEDIFYRPTHPYTKALLRAVPRLDMEGEKLETIEGAPPNMINPPKGCPFAQRCKERMDICETAFPEESKLSECHEVCCWLQKEGR